MGASQPTSEATQRRLSILAGAPFVPWPPVTYSHQVVVAKLGALAARHELVFLCSVSTAADEAALDELSAALGVTAVGVVAPNSRCRRSRVVDKVDVLRQGVRMGVPHRLYQAAHRPLRRSLQALATSRDFDLVHLDYWYLGMEWIAACPVPSVCYVHDLLYERLTRRADVQREVSVPWAIRGALEHALFLRGLRRTELATLAGFAALAAISPRDARELMAALPGHRIAALPAGVDVAALPPIRQEPLELQGVLFVGALASGPNEDAVHWFVKSAWPLVRDRCPEARFYVVGHHPSARIRGLDGRHGVVVVGGVSAGHPVLGAAPSSSLHCAGAAE